MPGCEARFELRFDTAMGEREATLTVWRGERALCTEWCPNLAGMAVSRDGRRLYVQWRSLRKTVALDTGEVVDEPHPSDPTAVWLLTELRTACGQDVRAIADDEALRHEPFAFAPAPAGPTPPAEPVAWTEDGRRWARGDAGGLVVVGDAVTGARVGRRHVLPGVRALAFDAIGARLAVAAGDVDTVLVLRADAPELDVVWARRHGTVFYSGSGDPFGFPDEEREAAAHAVAWRGDGALISVGEGEDAVVWSRDGARLEAHAVSGWVITTAVTASPAGWLVTGDERGELRLFVPGARAPADQARVAGAIAALTATDAAVTVRTTDGATHTLAVSGARFAPR